jgi:hypothetical protein
VVAVASDMRRKKGKAVTCRKVFVASEEEAVNKPRYKEYVYSLLRRPPPVYLERTTAEIEQKISQGNPYSRNEINSLRHRYPLKFWGGHSAHWESKFVQDTPPDTSVCGCRHVIIEVPSGKVDFGLQQRDEFPRIYLGGHESGTSMLGEKVPVGAQLLNMDGESTVYSTVAKTATIIEKNTYAMHRRFEFQIVDLEKGAEGGVPIRFKVLAPSGPLGMVFCPVEPVGQEKEGWLLGRKSSRNRKSTKHRKRLLLVALDNPSDDPDKKSESGAIQLLNPLKSHVPIGSELISLCGQSVVGLNNDELQDLLTRTQTEMLRELLFEFVPVKVEMSHLIKFVPKIRKQFTIEIPPGNLEAIGLTVGKQIGDFPFYAEKVGKVKLGLANRAVRGAFKQQIHPAQLNNGRLPLPVGALLISVDGKSMLELEYKFIALLFFSTKYKLKRKLTFIVGGANV